MVAPSTFAKRLATSVRLETWRIDDPDADAKSQTDFVFHTLGELFAEAVFHSGSNDDWINAFTNAAHVVSTHRSKSIELPVYLLVHPTEGIEIIMRGNFYDWKVSVISDKPVIDNFYGLFDPTKQWDERFCEGFDPAWIFAPYAENQQQFTLEVGGDFTLFTFLWLLIKGRES